MGYMYSNVTTVTEQLQQEAKKHLAMPKDLLIIDFQANHNFGRTFRNPRSLSGAFGYWRRFQERIVSSAVGAEIQYQEVHGLASSFSQDLIELQEIGQIFRMYLDYFHAIEQVKKGVQKLAAFEA